MNLSKENIGQRLKIDRSNWTKVRFKDVAIQQKKNVDRENTSLTRYVKGEHMGSEDLHLRKWGDLQDEYLGPAFIRKFEEGDILYGSRRTYLRKVVIAPFDGITANTTFVIKANEEVLDKRLLPFIMLSEGFAQHSVQNSKGSVNPYVNWKDLAKYEFLLPPKDQQARLAELLWAMDEVVEGENKSLKQLSIYLDSEVENAIHGLKLKGKKLEDILASLYKQNRLIALDKCGEILKGKGIPKASVETSGIPCVRYGELYTKHHRIIRNIDTFISNESALSATILKINDVLFAGSGETIAEIGKSAAFIENEKTYAGSDILIFRPYEMDGRFLGYLLNSQLVRLQLNKYATGATVMHIYPDDLRKIEIPKFSLKEQTEIARKLENIYSNTRLLKEQITSSKSLQKSLINQIFSPEP